MKNSSEKDFWQDLLSEKNPDWKINLPGFGAGLLAEQDVAIYLYDTSTQERMCCQTKSTAMRAAAGYLNGFSGVSAAIMEAFCELDADTSFLTADSVAQKVSREAMVLCMLNLTTTRTYRHVLSTHGNLSGHWLTLIYRFPEDGRLLLKPSFQTGNAHQLLSAQDLHSWTAQVVAQDLAPHNPLMAGFINDSGPPRLAEGLLNHASVRH